VDPQQHAHSEGMHMSNILSEDGGHERVVPVVNLPVQQLRRHVRLNLSTSSLSLSLSLRLSLSLSLSLGLSLGLSLSLVLSVVHSCSCIKKLNIQLRNKISNFLQFLQFLKQIN
jgi:hypothetical protein